jgi:hypothetical protein
MTVKESILRAVDNLPGEYLEELADFAQFLKIKAAHQRVPTALASEKVLARDWLRPEEDEAWQDFIKTTYGSCAGLGLEEPDDLPLPPWKG